MADDNPNKRKCVEGNDGWKTTRGQTRGDTLVEIANNWFAQNYLIQQHLNGVIRAENAALARENVRLTRSNNRHRLSAQVAQDTINSLRRERDFSRNLLADIFNRFPEVRHEYEQVLVTDEELTEEELDNE